VKRHKVATSEALQIQYSLDHASPSKVRLQKSLLWIPVS